MIALTALIIGFGYYFAFYKQETKTNTTVVTENATSTANVGETSSSVSSMGNVPVRKVTQPAGSPASHYAYLGKKTQVGAVMITPVKVSYDSRCPKDVRCIQAGTVDLGVLLEEGKLSQNVIVTLGKPFIFAEKTITLVSVYPERVSTKTIKESEYKFLFTVK